MRKSLHPSAFIYACWTFSQNSDVITVKQCVACFSSGESDMKVKACSGWPWTAAMPRNKKSIWILDQLVLANQWIRTSELSSELDNELMKDGLHGLAAVELWFTIVNVDFYECRIYALVHHCTKCITKLSTLSTFKNKSFCSQIGVLSNSVIVLFIYVMISMK